MRQERKLYTLLQENGGAFQWSRSSGHDQTRGLGHIMFLRSCGSSRVGSKEVLAILRVGSRDVGILWVGSGRPDLTRPASSGPTRE